MKSSESVRTGVVLEGSEVGRPASAVITDIDAFAALGEEWNAVLRASGSYTPQLSHEWLLAYWRHFAAGRQVEILVHRNKSGRIVGFSPFMTCRERNWLGVCRTLSFLGDDMSDYLDFILLDQCRGEVCVHEIQPFLDAKAKQVDRVLLRRIRQSSPNWRFLKRQWGDTFLPTGENPIIRLGTSADEFLGSLGRNTRRELQKRLARIAESGLTLAVEEIDGYRPDLLEEIVAMDAVRARATGHHSALSRPSVRRFFQEAAPALAARGELAGWVLRLGGELASYRLGFVADKTFLDWQTSYNMRLTEFDVGKILLSRAIENCFAKGYAEFNFLAGCEGYKLAWSNKLDFFYAYRWERENLSMRLMGVARALKRLAVR